MLKSGVFNLALLALAGAMTCPDGGGCEEGSTCCQVSTGRYGCCPLPRSFPMVHASFGNEDDDDTVCPDETRCPLEYSCVKSNNTYKCCPLAQGVSCSDGKHCCQEDHVCTADGRSCIKEKESVDAVVCPDGKSECPEESTCCQLPDDSWGCCPMAKAVCCEDRVHCCREGSTCDTGRSNCHSPTHGDTPMWEKLPARRRALWEDQTAVKGTPDVKDTPDVRDKPDVGQTSVTCPDGRSCPDLSTCCQQADGSYGCCPFPEAVCCTDHLHCCPSGTTCDLEHNKCSSAHSLTPLAKKIPARNGAVKGTPDVRDKPDVGQTSVTCPDGNSCPDLSTCCQQADGSYGCCPFPEAVCCTDHLHCCPSGTTCDLEHNKCSSAHSLTPLAKKIPARNGAVKGTPDVKDTPDVRDKPDVGQTSVTCPDGRSCPDLTTCCQQADGSYGCCPFPEAVCCDDHIHCCPKNTICDVSAGSCEEAKGSRPWLEKVPSLTRQAYEAVNVKCDSSHTCPYGCTCCKGETGDWACCPFPEAVCCSNMKYCCPTGYTCDLATGACFRSGKLSWDHWGAPFRKGRPILRP